MTQGNKPTGIAVGVIVQNDVETVAQSILSYYDYVDRILVTTDPKRGFSGKPIVPDGTVDAIRAIDSAGKIEIIEGDFYKYDEPMKNETYQRQVTIDRLAKQGDWRWILQVDADEVFLDFPSLVRRVRPLKFAQVLFWRLMTVFNTLDDGRLLVVVNEDGSPNLFRFPIGHRPGVTLHNARWLNRPPGAIYKVFNWRYEGGKEIPDSVLHLSYAKSEQRIKEKLATFGHSHDFDLEEFFALWLRSKTDWESVKNFHPLKADLWPALRPFSRAELERLSPRGDGGQS
jgi:hypothetical protein